MDQDNNPLDKMPEDREAIDKAVGELAGTFHEDWRLSRKQEDGSYEPRIKATKDEKWIAEHGTDQVDIANTKYEDLPEDWQAENKAAAGVVVGILDSKNGSLDLSDPSVRSEVGSIVHNAWLERNTWAKGGDLDMPFDELPESEQKKDIDQVVVALDLFKD